MCGFPLWRNGLHRLSNITCSRPYYMCWDHSVYMGAYGHIRRLYRCLMAISIYMYHKLFGSMALSSANTSTNNLSTDTDVPHVRISLQLEMFFSMPHYRTVLHEGGGRTGFRGGAWNGTWNMLLKILVTFKSFCPLPYYLVSRDYSVFVPCLSTAARAVTSKPEWA